LFRNIALVIMILFGGHIISIVMFVL
jgi:hypothetical protein